MLENIKYLMTLKTVDKNINDGNFELALEKLNFLIKEEFKPSQTYLKRGRLCKKIMMFEDAYSDFTYVIGHCVHKKEAYFERLFLNYEISNFYEAITDANMILCIRLSSHYGKADSDPAGREGLPGHCRKRFCSI